MNRHEFYDNLNKFKALQHSTNLQYYNKIDKYYPDGSARYFYSKAEWDAYVEGKNRTAYDIEQKKKKTAEEKNNMSGYAEWKKNEDAKKKIENQKKENIEKNKAASEHEGDRYNKPVKSNVEQSVSGREAAINKSVKSYQEAQEKNNYGTVKKIGEKAKDVTNKLYKHKDEIVEKANTYLKLADQKVGDFLDKFTENFPPELKSKVQKILNEIKDYAENIIDKLNNITEEDLNNINGFIDKIVDLIEDKIDQYSKELNDAYENYKDKVNPVFKDKDGNINWKLYLPLAAGVGIIDFIRKNPDFCYGIFSKIYNVGEKAFNFIDAKTDGKFSAALKQIPEKIDNYLMYKQLEDKGFGTFTVDDGKGGRVTYLDKVYNDYLNMEGSGYATMAANVLFGNK